MAVKSHGKDKSKILKITCKKCASKLTYTPKDAKSEADGGNMDTVQSVWFIECPDCNNKVYLKGQPLV